MFPTDNNLIKRINKFTASLIERSLTKLEDENLFKFIEENKQFVQTDDIIKYIAILADAYADIIENNQDTKTLSQVLLNNSEDSNLDTYNTKVDISHFMSITSIDQFIKEIIPVKKTAYISLDSKNATYLNNNTKLQWSLVNSVTMQDNNALITYPIKNITKVRCSSITIHKFPTNMQRASILIDELSEQSFIFPNGKRFHFLALVNNLVDPIDLNSRNTSTEDLYVVSEPSFIKYELLMGYRFNEGNYHFNKVVNNLDNITISIADPLNLIAIPKYEHFNVTITPDNYSMLIQFEEPHYLPIITQLNSNDDLISAVNSRMTEVYSIFIDDVIDENPPNNKTYVDLLIGKEWSNVVTVNDTTLRAMYRELPPGFHIKSSYTNLIIPNPLQSSFKARVRINTFRVNINLEIEYID
jgi:hypothetical protein